MDTIQTIGSLAAVVSAAIAIPMLRHQKQASKQKDLDIAFTIDVAKSRDSKLYRSRFCNIHATAQNLLDQKAFVTEATLRYELMNSNECSTTRSGIPMVITGNPFIDPNGSIDLSLEGIECENKYSQIELTLTLKARTANAEEKVFTQTAILDLPV